MFDSLFMADVTWCVERTGENEVVLAGKRNLGKIAVRKRGAQSYVLNCNRPVKRENV